MGDHENTRNSRDVSPPHDTDPSRSPLTHGADLACTLITGRDVKKDQPCSLTPVNRVGIGKVNQEKREVKSLRDSLHACIEV